MTIRVAFDISVLGNRFDSDDPKHGIYNVIEELLIELCSRGELDITAVGLSGTDPLASSVKSLLYLERKELGLNCSFTHTFKMGFGLTNLYARLFHATLSGAMDAEPVNSASKVLVRAVRSLLYRLSYNYRLLQPRHTFESRDFDVFHCPHPDLPPRSATGSLPRVITIYDLIPIVRPDFVREAIADKFKRSLDEIDITSDLVICISQFTKQEFCEYSGMSPTRVLVAPLAAARHCRPVTDPELLANTLARLGVQEGRYFLSLAAPQPRKNLAHLIRSFYRLLDDQGLRDIHLVLAGSKSQGWLYDEIFATAEGSQEHRSRVIFADYVSDSDLAVLYSGALAFVFPSLYEGFGMPPLEAMACGAPVISSNVTSLPEVVGDAGLMIDPLDENELFQTMLKVLSNADLRAEMRKKGFKRAAMFSWEKCAAQNVRAYYAAVGECEAVTQTGP